MKNTVNALSAKEHNKWLKEEKKQDKMLRKEKRNKTIVKTRKVLPVLD